MSVSCKLYKAPPQRWLTSQHNFTFLNLFMRWRLSHVYYERIPFLRLSACTTWFCSVRRPLDVLFEYYQSRKCSWIEKNPNFIALCFKIIQRSPPQSASQREITCQNICLCGWNWHASELSIGRQDEPEPSCFTTCWRGQVWLFVGKRFLSG